MTDSVPDPMACEDVDSCKPTQELAASLEDTEQLQHRKQESITNLQGVEWSAALSMLIHLFQVQSGEVYDNAIEAKRVDRCSSWVPDADLGELNIVEMFLM
jgi:hypothetical protein